MSVRLAALALVLAGCLDFDVFEVTPSVGGAGGEGAGAATGGGGATSVGGSTQGGGGLGGIAEVGPCYVGDPVTDGFDDPGRLLPWVTTLTTFVDGHALLSPQAGNGAAMSLDARPGVLDECYFQLALQDLEGARVSIEWRDLANGNNQLAFVLDLGQPIVLLLPGTGSAPLEDSSQFLQGYVRLGEADGVYFVSTAPSSDGPWSIRFRTSAATPPASWLDQEGFLYLSAYTELADDTVIVDELNTP